MRLFSIRGIFCFAAIAANVLSSFSAEVEVFFSPNGGCTDRLVKEIREATKTIDVAVYRMTSRRLSAALNEAATRGVACRLLVDEGQPLHLDHYAAGLGTGRLSIRFDKVEKIFHSKYVLIDGRKTLTGSFNWTDNAERRNAENLILIVDEELNAKYSIDFAKHYGHGLDYFAMPQETKAAAVSR